MAALTPKPTADALATLVGQVPNRIEKRRGDVRPYRIDCTPLLRQHELLVAVEWIDGTGLEVGPARARQGVLLEVQLGGGDLVDGSRTADHPLRAQVRTTLGAIEVVVLVRVHPV